MIPLKLTLKGIYSYQQETVIDFNQLTSAGLFGIFGAVGSGKSTILEAVTFALYGETERLNDRDKRNYNMMNLKCNDLLIEFEFETDNPAQRFKFTVKCKRRNTNFENLTSFDRKSYQWEQGGWVPTTKTAEDILGLSYNNFKRTIIIPQGKFQEFLQLTDGERVRMLKEIFNLEKFELSGKVSTLKTENDLRVSTLQGQMSGLPEYDEERLNKKDEIIQSLTSELETKQSAIEKKVKEEQEFQELKKLAADKLIKEKLYAELQIKKDEFASLEAALVQFESCQQLFQERFVKRAEMEQELERRSRELSDFSGQLTTVANDIETAERKKAELSEAYRSRETLLQKVAELNEVILLQSLLEKAEGIRKERNGIEENLHEEEDLEKEAQNNVATLKIEVKLLEGIVPDTGNLMFLQSMHTQQGTLLIRMNEILQTLTNLERRKKKLEEDRRVVVNELRTELEVNDDVSIDSLQTFGKDRVKTLKENLKTCQNQLTDLKAHQKLEEFSTFLIQGDACPLCGAIEHPQLYTAHDAEKLISEKEADMEQIGAQIESIEKALKETNDSSLSIQPLELQIKEHEKNLTACNDTLTGIRNALATKGLDENTLETALKEAKEGLDKLDSLREKVENETEVIKTINERIQAYKNDVERLGRDLSAKEAEINTRKEKVQSLHLENEIGKSTSEIQDNIATLRESHRSVTTNYEETDRQLQESQKQQEKLKGNVETLASVVAGLSDSLLTLKLEIADLLKQHSFEEINVQAILAKNLLVTAERKKISTYREQLHAALVQLQDATQKLEGRVYNETAHTELSASILQMKEEHQKQNEQLIGERKELGSLRSEMEKHKELQMQLDNLLQRAENLKVLVNLFRSSGFVNFVSSVYLQNLVNTANDRFHRMTKRQLMLELTDKNDFQICDFINEGKVRSVKTLSGGQTFQAALSLALALADNIQQLTHSSQNFFFLDEGFGSLDKEALDIVFQTLKGLKKENRIVGVISHVEEMQQEIQVNLRVTNHPETGSEIEKSWIKA